MTKGTSTYTFTDAQEMHRNHPKTFWAPTERDLQQLVVGDLIKVCINEEERFWAEIKAIDGDTLRCRVDNDLMYEDHGLSFNDEFSCHKNNVYDILTKEDLAKSLEEDNNE